jgi:hypothetical protein
LTQRPAPRPERRLRVEKTPEIAHQARALKPLRNEHRA